jgi:hypothetical protein
MLTVLEKGDMFPNGFIPKAYLLFGFFELETQVSVSVMFDQGSRSTC